MRKGSFNIETFNQDKDLIVMRDWVEPTLMNTGTTVLYIQGIPVNPGQSFILGPAGVRMEGEIQIMFNDSALATPNDKHEAKVSYVTLIKEEC